METKKVNTVSDKLSKYLWGAGDNDYITITDWVSGEGWDIEIQSENNNIMFRLHMDELNAINYLTKAMQYENND